MQKFMLRNLFGNSKGKNLKNFYGLDRHGIRHKDIAYNLSVSELYSIACQNILPTDHLTKKSTLSSVGAMVAYSGERTGRSPKDKRIVVDSNSSGDIWWGHVNIPISQQSNEICESLAMNYLNTCRNLYIVDGYAGWDPQHRIKVRIVCSRSYHALFMKNMLIRPSQEELMRDFSDDNSIDFHVFNAGEMKLPKGIEGVGSQTSVQLNFDKNKAIIFGTQYAGEMKKGVFTIMQYLMPLKNILTMHCSATEGKKGDVTLYFGLSGTGKTTLSADPSRNMLGDDEHCWSQNGVFNIEGGCYAKCIGLSKEKEPDIFNAIKFGALVENVGFLDNKTKTINYNDVSITENTRCSYPLSHIKNAKFPSQGGHPQNIIFLTCDAFGVLPPISMLTKEQAMYHFISGYTAKVAGTEVGIKEPLPTFSACFGEAFLAFHPTKYAEMLKEKIAQHNSKIWLINTGWSGGKYGVGKRMDLKITRQIIDNIHSGYVDQVEWDNFEVFNFKVPKNLEGVDTKILHPRNTWQNEDEYNLTLNKLAQKFQKNFDTYRQKASEELIKAEPVMNMKIRDDDESNN